MARVFAIVAAAAVGGSVWLLVAGRVAADSRTSGRTGVGSVPNTSGGRPFCLVVDWTAAAIIATVVVVDGPFHH